MPGLRCFFADWGRGGYETFTPVLFMGIEPDDVQAQERKQSDDGHDHEEYSDLMH